MIDGIKSQSVGTVTTAVTLPRAGGVACEERAGGRAQADNSRLAIAFGPLIALGSILTEGV